MIGEAGVRVFVLGNYMDAHFMYVERLPRAGESLVAQRAAQEHGGKGLNLGLGLHRLGADVDMLLAVGKDPAGASALAALAAEGLDDVCFLTLGETSGFGVGFIAPDGANFLATHLGANALLRPAHVDLFRPRLLRADWLVGHFELPGAVVRHAFALARAGGVTTYLNPSPWRAIDPELLRLTDVLVVNACEAVSLFAQCVQPKGHDWPRGEWVAHLPALAAGIGWQGRLLVVTLAEAGCVALAAAEQVIDVGAFPVEQVDATGAGDAFGCGLLHALARGETLPQALLFANACGAHVASRAGVFAHLPRPAEVAAVLAAANPARA